MTEANAGQAVADARERIEREFDEWVAVTGALEKDTGWYYEAKSFIADCFKALSPIPTAPVQSEGLAEIIKGLLHAASDRSDRLQQTAAIDRAVAYLYATSPQPVEPPPGAGECDTLWCESCGETPQSVQTDYAGLCAGCATKEASE